MRKRRTSTYDAVRNVGKTRSENNMSGGRISICGLVNIELYVVFCAYPFPRREGVKVQVVCRPCAPQQAGTKAHAVFHLCVPL